MEKNVGTTLKFVVFVIAALGMALAANAQRTAVWPLAQRIGNPLPTLQTRPWGHSHGAIGLNRCTPLVDSGRMDVNFMPGFPLFCESQPGGGPAEHFHQTVEEMFTPLTGALCLTIDSHTSLIKAPAGAPQQLHHSHGNLNCTKQNVYYLNYDVTEYKGHYDAENLLDSRLHVTLDPIPQFVVMHLDRSLMRPIKNYHGGTGTVLYARALDDDIFLTNWAYMDHEIIPPGASDGLEYHHGVEEIYFVMNGSGIFRLNGETAPIHKWEGIPVRFNEPYSITNNGSSDLELLIEGVAARKGVLDTEVGPLSHRQ